MSRVRVLWILNLGSLALTATSAWATIVYRHDPGPAHVLADWGWSMSIASWLIVAMFFCTRHVADTTRTGFKKVSTKVDRVDSHVVEVVDVVGDIDKDRVQANAVVVQMFRDRAAR